MEIQNILPDGTCWITESKLPDDLIEYADKHFDELYALHPDEMGHIVMHKEVKSARYHKSFLNSPELDDRFDGGHNSYMFCGKNQNANHDLPDEFKPFLTYLNDIQEKNNKPLYNQVTVNWYDNGSNYIPFHSDSEIGMIKDATIVVVSLGGEINNIPTRKFKLIDKKNTTRRFEYSCYNGLVLTMGGDTQKRFRHGVPKVIKSSQRISLSFRQFKCDK